MYRFPEHQAGGHKAKSGQLGPQIDTSGKFYKPLQSGDRGKTELWFYKSFHSNKSIPPHIHKFIPEFHGTKTIPASDGSGPQPHLVLEDVLSPYTKPCIIDLKIGSRTWYPGATDEYVAKCWKKDAETTSVKLGFRVSGVKVWEEGEGGLDNYWVPEKKEVLGYGVEDVRSVLRRFVGRRRRVVVCGEVLRLLEELKVWFEEQCEYQFNSCSVLIVYEGGGEGEGEGEGEGVGVSVKLIDFAHVYEGDGIIDHNCVGGICSVIKFFKDVVRDDDDEVGGVVEEKKKKIGSNGVIRED